MFTPADAEKHLATAGRNLTRLLRLQINLPTLGDPCSWRLVTFDHLSTAEFSAAAWLIADEIMKSRAAAGGKYDTWRNAALGTAPLDAAGQTRLAPFVEPVFGLKAAPKSKTQVQGYVSEWLWYLLTRERTEPHRRLQFIDPPKFSVTDGGGDGLVVYDVGSPDLTFALWEVKKHDGDSKTVTDIVRGAAGQLKMHGARYLAELSGPLKLRGFAALAEVISDLWIDEDARSGAGVSVTTSQTTIPSAPLRPLATKMPGRANPGQLEGLVCAVADYDRLARLVRWYVWTPF